jgi:hypothetical protein
MSWYKVSMTSEEIIEGKGIKFQSEFAGIFIVKGSPVDAAMFSNRSGIENDYYFTPEAFRIAKELILGYAGVECPDPVGSTLSVLVSNGSKWQKFVMPLFR